MSSNSSMVMIIINCQMPLNLEVHQTCTSSSTLLIDSYITWLAIAASNSTSTVLPAMAPLVAMEAQTLSTEKKKFRRIRVRRLRPEVKVALLDVCQTLAFECAASSHCCWTACWPPPIAPRSRTRKGSCCRSGKTGRPRKTYKSPNISLVK